MAPRFRAVLNSHSMRYIYIVHLLLFCIVLSGEAQLAAAVDSLRTPWPYAIDPSGSPIVAVPLITLEDSSFFPILTANHTLVFDGAHYISRIGFKEIESHLIPAGTYYFEWLSLDGNRVQLDTRNPAKLQNAGWTLKRSAGDIFSIQSLDGSISYKYAAGLLRHFTAHGSDYRFEYDEHGMTRLVKLGSTELCLLNIEYDANGVLKRLLTARAVIRLRFNKDLQLESCVDETTGTTIASFSYRNRLLVTATNAGQKTPYQWGSFRWREYATLPILMQPLVVSDGHYQYFGDMHSARITIEVREFGRQPSARWELDTRTGTVSLFSRRE